MQLEIDGKRRRQRPGRRVWCSGSKGTCFPTSVYGVLFVAHTSHLLLRRSAIHTSLADPHDSLDVHRPSCFHGSNAPILPCPLHRTRVDCVHLVRLASMGSSTPPRLAHVMDPCRVGLEGDGPLGKTRFANRVAPIKPSLWKGKANPHERSRPAQIDSCCASRARKRRTWEGETRRVQRSKCAWEVFCTRRRRWECRERHTRGERWCGRTPAKRRDGDPSPRTKTST